MEVLTLYRSTLTRLASEALMIESAKEGTLMNEKSEWGGTRLVCHTVAEVMF